MTKKERGLGPLMWRQATLWNEEKTGKKVLQQYWEMRNPHASETETKEGTKAREQMWVDGVGTH